MEKKKQYSVLNAVVYWGVAPGFANRVRNGAEPFAASMHYSQFYAIQPYVVGAASHPANAIHLAFLSKAGVFCTYHFGSHIVFLFFSFFKDV